MWLMGINIKVNGKMEIRMEWELMNFKIKTIIMEIGWMEKDVDKVFISGIMGKFIKENGKMIK
jgi:hypothetical protein